MFTKLRNLTCSTLIVSALALGVSGPAFASTETVSHTQVAESTLQILSNNAENPGEFTPEESTASNLNPEKNIAVSPTQGVDELGEDSDENPSEDLDADLDETQEETSDEDTASSDGNLDETSDEDLELVEPDGTETPAPLSETITPRTRTATKPAKPAVNNCQIPQGRYSATPSTQTELRLSGPTRYETAISIMKAVKAEGEDGGRAVFLASGANYADALALGALAAAHGWPLLLTENGRLTPAVKNSIKATKPTHIFIAGGTGTISKSVERAAASFAEKNVKVRRFAGANRYETSEKIAKCFPAGSDAFLVSGTNFPDAVTAGAPAANKGGAIVLTKPGKLHAAARQALKHLTPEATFVIGGKWSAGTKNAITKAGGKAPVVISGTDRYATSAAVAKHFYGQNPSKALFAVGTGYADALSGVSVAKVNNAPIILSQTSCRPTALNDVTAGLKQRILLGGKGSITTQSATKACSAKSQTTGQKVVRAAMAQIGKHYLSGGASPATGFDCSGLVQYSYKQAGKSIPRTSYAQWASGKKVGKPQPGDVVVMLGGAHVGVYLGGGKMVDSPKPGASVGVRSVFAVNDYVRF